MIYRVKRFKTRHNIWDDVITADEQLELFLNDPQNKIDEIINIIEQGESIALVYGVDE